jgi:hypothetical protein
VPFVINFQAIKARPLLEGKIEFVGIPDLKNNDIVLGMPEVGQSIHHRIQITKAIRYQDDEPASFQLGGQFMKDGSEVRFSPWRGFLKHIDDVAHVGGLSSRGKDFPSLGVKGDETHAVRLPEHHVGQASR